MKNVLKVVITAVVALALAGAAVAGAKPTARSATLATSRSGLGRIVVNGQGRTLYLFEKDTHSHSACSGICAAYWPPVLANGKAIAMTGAKQSLIGSIARADGSRQVTYAGHPLYVFSGDSGRGQTNGEGLKDFGAGWYVLTPSGKKIDRD
jgi:predicted lipoprotein with Yx(FWY)xxD motif